MPKPTVAKRRAFRIPTDYFKRTGPLGRWKLILSLLALVLVPAWWAYGWTRSPGGQHLATHGPVAAVHATWEDDCNACHVPFSPIRGERWNASLGVPVTAANQRCEACHAGPAHHASQVPAASSQRCTQCHHDHLGRDAKIARVPDSDCTSCHGDLKAHTTSKAPAYAAQITAFAADHPNFAPLAKPDPGRLKFNHKLHMEAGLGTNFTLAKLDPADRARYRTAAGQSDSSAIRLDCASCHQPDAVTTPPGLAAPGSGAYMLPVTYANHCRACHPTTVEDRPRGEGRGRGALAVPHGLQPDKLHGFLWGAFTEELLKKDPAKAASPRAPRRMPGVDEEEAREAQSRWEAIAGKVRDAEEILYVGKSTCLECHETEPVGGLSPIEPGKAPAFAIAEPAVPNVWYKHGLFDHAAHRGVSCRECHAPAYDSSEKGADVNLPGVENCRRCHAPAGRDPKGEPAGGVRHDCNECHRYHNGDNAPQGVGAPARDAALERSIRDFLSASGRAK